MKLSALMATALLLSASVYAQAARIPKATHAYGLNGSYADELGGPALAPLGGYLGKERYKFSPAQGLALVGAVPAEHYSIEIQLAPDSVDGYRRVLEFKNLGSDLGLFIADGRLTFYYLGGTWNVSITAGKLNDVVLTRDSASKLVKMYADGVYQAEFVDDSATPAANFALNEAGQTVAYFMQDRLEANTGGSVNHIRIFDVVLTDAQIASLAKGKLPRNVWSD